MYFLPAVLASSPLGARLPGLRYFFESLDDLEWKEYWANSDNRGVVAVEVLECVVAILDQHIFAVLHKRSDLSYIWRLAQVPISSYFDCHFGSLDTQNLSEILHYLNYPKLRLVHCTDLFQWRSLFPGVCGRPVVRVQREGPAAGRYPSLCCPPLPLLGGVCAPTSSPSE